MLRMGDRIEHYKFFNQSPSLMWQYRSDDYWYFQEYQMNSIFDELSLVM